MARKDFYVDYDSLYNGDGSTHSRPITAGSVGCWNDFTDTESLQVSGGDVNSQWYVWFRQQIQPYQTGYFFGSGSFTSNSVLVYNYSPVTNTWTRKSGKSSSNYNHTGFQFNRIWINYGNQWYETITDSFISMTLYSISSHGSITENKDYVWTLSYDSLYRLDFDTATSYVYLTTAMNYSSYTKSTTNRKNIHYSFHDNGNDYCENNLVTETSTENIDFVAYSVYCFCYLEEKLYCSSTSYHLEYDLNTFSSVSKTVNSLLTQLSYDSSTLIINKIAIGGGDTGLDYYLYNNITDIWESTADKPESIGMSQGAH